VRRLSSIKRPIGLKARSSLVENVADKGGSVPGRSHWSAALGAALAIACTAGDAKQAETQEAVVSEAAPSAHEYEDRCAAPLVDGNLLAAHFSNRQYAELETLLERIYADSWADPACESRVWHTFGWFASQRLTDLEAWVAARPDSWTALTVRGNYWMGEGYRRRGQKLSKDVVEDAWRGLHEAFAAARSDLDAAIEQEPRAGYAYAGLMGVFQASADKSEISPYLDRLLALDPNTYQTRRAAIVALSPRWGGSLVAIRAIAEVAQTHVDRNPRLRVLLGFADAAQGVNEWNAGDRQRAIEHMRRALSFGGQHEWYETLCNLYYIEGEHENAIRTATDWLEYDVHWAEALHWRSKSHREIGLYQRAREDLDQAVELWPEGEQIRKSRAYLLELRGDDLAAVEDLQKALELDPNDTWTLLHLSRRLAGPLDRADEAEPHLRRLIEIEPNSPEPWFHLGNLLLARGAGEARATLEHYLALAQGDTEETTRIARAEQLLNPAAPARAGAPNVPGLAHVRRNQIR
jgi:tetratricopeptide (TPR) repeat protein